VLIVYRRGGQQARENQQRARAAHCDLQCWLNTAACQASPSVEEAWSDLHPLDRFVP